MKKVENISIKDALQLVRRYRLKSNLGDLLAVQLNDELAKKVKQAEIIVREYWRGIEIGKVLRQPRSYTLPSGEIVSTEFSHLYPEPPPMLGDGGLQQIVEQLEKDQC